MYLRAVIGVLFPSLSAMPYEHNWIQVALDFQCEYTA
jgi:hypothetical protein